jgi:hypothetical protein
MLGHTGYYHKFIKGYVQITKPMEKLLKKEDNFQWNEDCEKGVDVLKQNLVVLHIFVFPYWWKEFHIHVDTSSIEFDALLAQPGEGELDHPISFSRTKLSIAEKKYTMTERECMEMVYSLQRFRHYLLGYHIKMYIDHSTLKNPVNKTVFGGRIYRWLLFSQEYYFEVILNPGKLNAGPNHLSQILIGEYAGRLDGSLPNAHLLSIQMVDNHFAEIVQYLSTRVAPSDMTIA